MRGLIVVLSYLVAMVVLAMAQIFPPTGLLLDVLMALSFGYFAYAIGVLFHGMLIHTAAAAWRGRIERAWALLPAAVYMGFAIHGALAYHHVLTLKARIEAKATVEREGPPPRAVAFFHQDGLSSHARDVDIGLAAIARNTTVFIGDERYEVLPAAAPACRHPAPQTVVEDQPRISGSCVLAHPGETVPDGAMKVIVDAPAPDRDTDESHSFLFASFRLEGLAGAEVKPGTRYTFFDGRRVAGEAESGKIVYPFWIPIPHLACYPGDEPGWGCNFGLVTRALRYGTAPGFDNENLAEAGYIAELLRIAPP